MPEKKTSAKKPTARPKPASAHKPKAKVAASAGEAGESRAKPEGAVEHPTEGRTAAKGEGIAPKAQNRFSAARKPKTYVPKPNDIVRRWHLVDADGLVLGRAASRIAHILRGKHKAMYTPHADAGDYVVVINAEKVKLTGSKEEKKIYYRHSLHPGGLKATLARDVRARTPERLIERAVRLMIPRNPLGREVLRKLKIYVGPVHPHQAQHPQPLKLDL
jgi:large subunit ribosomal protein L13